MRRGTVVTGYGSGLGLDGLAGVWCDGIASVTVGTVNNGTVLTVGQVGQLDAALADPAGATGGHADHQGVVGHVARNHGAGGDEGVAADGGATDHGGVSTDTGTLAHNVPVYITITNNAVANAPLESIGHTQSFNTGPKSDAHPILVVTTTATAITAVII